MRSSLDAPYSLESSLKTWILFGALALVAGVTGWLVFGPAGLVLGAAMVTLMGTFGARVSERFVMALMGARRLASREAPWLFAQVAALAHRAGLPTPELYFSPSPEPNAMALRTSDGPGALAVTGGLLSMLSPAELEGVLAHEIAHLRHGDTELLHLSNLLSRLTLSALRIATWIAFFGVLLTGGGVAKAATLALLALGVPVIIAALRNALSQTREHAADEGAVALTGRPRALASALVKLEQVHRRWLRLALPVPQWLRSHPPTKERVERLLDM